VSIWAGVAALRGEGKPGDPSPDERGDPEGRFYSLAELSVEGQHDPEVQRAYAAELLGFTLYRDQESNVKAVFDGYEYSFQKPGPAGPEALRKEDLPPALLEQAVLEGYATLGELAEARARRPHLADLGQTTVSPLGETESDLGL
jgi:hypothetical protein